MRLLGLGEKNSVYRKVIWRFAKSALLVAVSGALVWATLSPVQGFGQEELTRRIKTKVLPVYPELAKSTNIRGRVKLLVVVSPNGFVKDSKAIGGNPVLVGAALDAIKRWQFEASAEESTGTVEFRFEPPVR